MHHIQNQAQTRMHNPIQIQVPTQTQNPYVTALEMAMLQAERRATLEAVVLQAMFEQAAALKKAGLKAAEESAAALQAALRGWQLRRQRWLRRRQKRRRLAAAE